MLGCVCPSPRVNRIADRRRYEGYDLFSDAGNPLVRLDVVDGDPFGKESILVMGKS
jgi:hypothetical protein